MCTGTRTSGHMPYGLMAAYTFVFYTLLLMNSGLCRLVKINFVFLKDTAFISSKFRFDQCTDCRVISVPKLQMDRQTDMQTDGQTTFQLYIVDKGLIFNSAQYNYITLCIHFECQITYFVKSIYNCSSLDECLCYLNVFCLGNKM